MAATTKATRIMMSKRKDGVVDVEVLSAKKRKETGQATMLVYYILFQSTEHSSVSMMQHACAG